MLGAPNPQLKEFFLHIAEHGTIPKGLPPGIESARIEEGEFGPRVGINFKSYVRINLAGIHKSGKRSRLFKETIGISRYLDGRPYAVSAGIGMSADYSQIQKDGVFVPINEFGRSLLKLVSNYLYR
ncbi:MAG: hypothetical protein V1835_06785 [Candidatus Micrarchaeota archaeon]